jgi:hypothetical protein
VRVLVQLACVLVLVMLVRVRVLVQLACVLVLLLYVCWCWWQACWCWCGWRAC